MRYLGTFSDVESLLGDWESAISMDGRASLDHHSSFGGESLGGESPGGESAGNELIDPTSGGATGEQHAVDEAPELLEGETSPPTGLGTSAARGSERAIRVAKRRRNRNTAKKIFRVGDKVVTGVMVVVVGSMFLLMIGSKLGYQALAVRSGSMTPTLRVGDLVVEKPVRPTEVLAGRIVTFRDAALGQQLVTHRVVQVRRDGLQVDFVTKGDANKVSEHWSVPAGGTIGVEVLSLPKVGRLLVELQSKPARSVELSLAVIWFGNVIVRWLWRKPKRAYIAGSVAPPEEESDPMPDEGLEAAAG